MPKHRPPADPAKFRALPSATGLEWGAADWLKLAAREMSDGKPKIGRVELLTITVTGNLKHWKRPGRHDDAN